MKLNFGCGQNHLDGFINVDKFAECNPDIQMDIEALPWSFGTNSVAEVVFNHCLEHVGADNAVFFGIIQELYRVCKPGALIQINVPHPRHDNFINDPTHVRIITPEVLSLFSKANNHKWRTEGAANSPLALYLDVDFEITTVGQVIEDVFIQKVKSQEITQEQLASMSKYYNNIEVEYKITLKVVK